MSNIDKQALRERYSAKPIPKCHICGTEMTIQRMSGSRVTYGCSGAIYDETGCHYADGRSLADDHYEQSRVTVTDESDPDVLALLDELEAKDAGLQEYRKASQALKDVAAERQRQMSVEGWTPKHDDKHDNNELAFAASCYAFHSAAASWDFEDDGTLYDIHPAPKNWPWSPEWWKPKNPRRDLVKAGALILAEIERIDRAAGKGEAS